MTVADDEFARIGSVVDDRDRGDAPRRGASNGHLAAPVREALALREALQPIVGITIKLGGDGAPGAEAQNDAEWAAVVALARRDVLANQAAGVDHGLAPDHLRLLNRIDALLGSWPDDDWDALARLRVQELVDARRRGRRRGRELRRNRQDPEAREGVSVGWLLRHPADHWLRQALPRIADSECRRLLKAQVAKLQPGYRNLCALNVAAAEDVADVICDMKALGTSDGGWREPISAVVTASIKGKPSLGGHIAVRLVRDPDGPFNGTTVSVLPDERWLLCARELPDGSLLPLDGTRRRAIPF